MANDFDPVLMMIAGIAVLGPVRFVLVDSQKRLGRPSWGWTSFTLLSMLGFLASFGSGYAAQEFDWTSLIFPYAGAVTGVVGLYRLSTKRKGESYASGRSTDWRAIEWDFVSDGAKAIEISPAQQDVEYKVDASLLDRLLERSRESLKTEEFAYLGKHACDERVLRSAERFKAQFGPFDSALHFAFRRQPPDAHEILISAEGLHPRVTIVLTNKYFIYFKFNESDRPVERTSGKLAIEDIADIHYPPKRTPNRVTLTLKDSSTIDVRNIRAPRSLESLSVMLIHSMRQDGSSSIDSVKRDTASASHEHDFDLYGVCRRCRMRARDIGTLPVPCKGDPTI